jgi:cell wall-associated NlpC family hydrolase
VQFLDCAAGFAGAYIAGSALAYEYPAAPAENTPASMYDESQYTPLNSKGRPLTVSAGQDIVKIAKDHQNAPYKWGGNDFKTGIDCSHFVNKVYEAGFPYEYSSTTAFPSNPHFSPVTNPQPGDVGVWSGRHMTIYTGNGNTFGAFGAGRGAGPLPVSRFSFPSNPTWYRYHTSW